MPLYPIHSIMLLLLTVFAYAKPSVTDMSTWIWPIWRESLQKHKIVDDAWSLLTESSVWMVTLRLFVSNFLNDQKFNIILTVTSLQHRYPWQARVSQKWPTLCFTCSSWKNIDLLLIFWPFIFQ